MSELRSFSVWIWWFHLPVQLQETNNFSTLVCQTGLQEDDCPWKWGSVHCDKLGFWGYTEVHRRAGIPLVLSSYGNHSCSMILLHSLKFGFFVHNGVSQWWIWCSVASWYWNYLLLWHCLHGTCELLHCEFVFCFLLFNHGCITVPPCCSGSVA